MTINLTPQQIAWLQAFAAERGFASVDEAAQFLIGEAIADAKTVGLDDLDPDEVKRLLEEAERDIAEGRMISGEAFKAHLKARIKSFEG